MSETLTDPREIRKLLSKAAYRGERIDGKQGSGAPSMASGLAAHVLRLGEHNGYSGEDTMTVLAYHALLRYESALDLLIENANLRLSPQLLMPNADTTGAKRPG